jgi:two-component system sensor histidine kinase RegB
MSEASAFEPSLSPTGPFDAQASDRLPGGTVQADPRHGGIPTTAAQLWDWSQARRGLRLRTLILLRWVSIAGQFSALCFVTLFLNFRPPIGACLAVLALAATVNLSLQVIWPGARVAGRREALAQLGFDICELTAILALTGGLQNPFSLLLLAPVTVAAATLPSRSAATVGLLALSATGVLAIWAGPLPWRDGAHLMLPHLYQMGVWAATTAGIVFTGVYAWQAQSEAQRMELALATTQAVLAREQRLSALGGLAAAAAHELGTPLATIQLVSKEMLLSLKPGDPAFEDVSLLVSQTERCRSILRSLSRAPDAQDARHARMSLSQLLIEIAEPYRTPEIAIETDVTCSVGAAILEVKRLPEVLHGLAAFVENATDFADSLVEISAYYDADRLIVDVRDDGKGFPPEVLARLGEPYVTTRSHGEGSRSGHQGMGLGFFIAKTLLERTGAVVEFRNARRGGAVISSRWPRDRVEAPKDEGF